MINIDISGIPEIQASMKRYAGDAGEKFEKTILLAGLIIQGEAQRRTPVDTGLLRNSARTNKRGKSFQTEITVSFNTSYAVIVHEVTYYRHVIGEAKFLENAVNAKMKDVTDLFIKVFS